MEMDIFFLIFIFDILVFFIKEKNNFIFVINEDLDWIGLYRFV